MAELTCLMICMSERVPTAGVWGASGGNRRRRCSPERGDGQPCRPQLGAARRGTGAGISRGTLDLRSTTAVAKQLRE